MFVEVLRGGISENIIFSFNRKRRSSGRSLKVWPADEAR